MAWDSIKYGLESWSGALDYLSGALESWNGVLEWNLKIRILLFIKPLADRLTE